MTFRDGPRGAHDIHQWVVRNSNHPKQKELQTAAFLAHAHTLAEGLGIPAEQIDQIDQGRSTQIFLEYTSEAVEAASTFYITPDMSDYVVEHALKVTRCHLTPTLMPTPYGIAIFGNPVKTPTDSVRCISWAPLSPMERKAFDRSSPRMRDMLSQISNESASAIGIWTWVLKDDIDPSLIELEPSIGTHWDSLPAVLLVEFNTLAMDGQTTAIELKLCRGDQPVRPSAGLALMSFWELARTRSRYYLSERDALAKREARLVGKKQIPEWGQVNVVALRNERPVTIGLPADTQPVKWSHRWKVRGHWRNQAHGPGRKQRRWTWIDAYTKGPEDAPFIHKNSVYKLGTTKQQKAR